MTALCPLVTLLKAFPSFTAPLPSREGGSSTGKVLSTNCLPRTSAVIGVLLCIDLELYTSAVYIAVGLLSDTMQCA